MVSSLLRHLSGSIRRFRGTGAAGLPGPVQCRLALAAQAEFIICDKSIDEVFLTINGERHYVWRAVDQDDNVLDILVQSRRNKHAAKKFFRKLLKGLRYVPRVIMTDKLKSDGAAKRETLPRVEHRQSRYLNNPTTSLDMPLCMPSCIRHDCLSICLICNVPSCCESHLMDLIERWRPHRSIGAM